ncbi:hypothetical protein M9H77_29445 [Catharanthus roseus]|uniref:Uncharacterized protein n=1 Tax=Catharanthus roseus TaxID=4058 RepID=A0ACB9ZUF3_CATRO|nr:hypothetical protein M9H77_29445 [Catharanthus roseus]
MLGEVCKKKNGVKDGWQVTQNVDLSSKVDALSKRFDPLLALNTLPTNSLNVQGTSQFSPRISQSEQPIFKYVQSRLEKEATRRGRSIRPTTISAEQTIWYDCLSWFSISKVCTPSPFSKLETQIGQLANAISRRDEGKIPNHLIENPRTNHHEQVKAVITLRNGKLVDNKVGEPIKDSKLNRNETDGIDIGTKIERKIEKELASSSNSKTLESSSTASYKPKGLGVGEKMLLFWCQLFF